MRRHHPSAPDIARVLPCAEFPNDNPDLHAGSIWVCTTVGGEPECELPAPEPEGEPRITPREEAATPAPVGLEIYDDGCFVGDDSEESADIEIVDDLGFEEATPEGDGPASSPRPADPFERLTLLVKEVALTFGGDASAAAQLDAILGVEPSAAAASRALAWRGILRGESEDYEACGAATLDEWAADVVASVVGGAARADGIRRELRRRGVAAFGLVEDAA